MAIDNDKLMERYRSMLEYQSDIYPFPPTMRELQRIWELNTTSAVHLALTRMEDMGMVFVRKLENKTYYYAKPRSLINP